MLWIVGGPPIKQRKKDLGLSFQCHWYEKRGPLDSENWETGVQSQVWT